MSPWTNSTPCRPLFTSPNKAASRPAAQVMESSLPAMVRTLAGFEAQLGVRLFNRTTRRISLTEEGRRHLESCRQLLAALADAEAALSDRRRRARGPPAPSPRPCCSARCTWHRPSRVLCSASQDALLHGAAGPRGQSAGGRHRRGHTHGRARRTPAWWRRRWASIRRLVVASPAWLRRHGGRSTPRTCSRPTACASPTIPPHGARSMTGAGRFRSPSVVIWSSTRSHRPWRPARRVRDSARFSLTRWRRF